jgi:tetratricopeptide (TPR) repeat protein
MKKIALLFTAILVLSSVSVYAQKGQANLENGKKLFEQEDYDGVIRELSEAIRLDPQIAEAYAYRARAYVGDNNDQALSDANMAIQLNSQLAMGYFARGNVYINKEDYDRAIADYNEAIRLDPKDAYILQPWSCVC